MRIFAFHLLNDYSGSPKVLSQLLKGWTKNNIEVHMITCDGRTGFLSDIEKVNYHYYPYKFAVNPYLRLYRLVMSQLIVVWKMLFILKKEDIIYVNTVLPFGGSLIGKMKGCKIVYHIHETTMKPALLKKFLFGIARWTANDVIFVSNYLAKQEPLPKSKQHILYNAIENDFLDTAVENRTTSNNPKNTLLVCSLKEYKGVNEFVELANNLQTYHFRLVVNANQSEIDLYFKEINIPINLEIYPTQTNLHPFYQWADLIVNFSKPSGWIETFGLTIIEGMAYGLPAIVPVIGGITELVVEEINGYQIDSENTVLLIEHINNLFKNENLYTSMSEQSKKKIFQFSEDTFLKQNIEILNKLTNN